MRKTIYLVILLFFVALTAMAQSSNYAEVKDLASFRQEFAEESGKILSITSNFRQVKELIALTEKISSSGKFWFKRSNKVRIDYEKPFTYRLIMNGDKILIKDDQKENRVNVKSNKLFQQVNRIMLDCIQGTILNSSDFATRVFQNEKKYRLELTPSSKALQDFFDKIVLVVNKSDYAVDEIEMLEPGGDRTILTFTNKVLNKPVNDEVFAL